MFGAQAVIAEACSLARPVNLATPMNTLPSAAVSPRAPTVPTRAIEVWAFTPWVR